MNTNSKSHGGFREYIKKRLPESWVIALKEQKAYYLYVNLLYISVEKTARLGESNSGYNKKNYMYTIINNRLKNCDTSHPLDLLNSEEKKAATDTIDNYQLINRIDVINYNAG